MMTEKEREINFADLFWKIIYGWRAIILCAIIFSIALAGMKYLKSAKAAEGVSPVKEITLEDLEENLTDEEKEALSTAKNLQKQLAANEKYRDESIYINLDAYAKNTVTLQYYVNTHYVMNYTDDVEPDISKELTDSYASYINNRGMSAQLKAALNWDISESYVDELISAESLGEKQFVVHLSGEDEAQAQKIAEQVEMLIQDYKPVMDEKIGQHDLTKVGSYTSIIKDSELVTNQTNLQNVITDLQTKLKTLTATFTSAQNQILTGELENKQEITIAAASFSVKYLILGAFMGVVLACGWIALCFIFSNRMKKVQELQEVYDLRVLGEATCTKKKKRILSIVDTWLDKLSHREVWSFEEQKTLILTNLRVTCQKENIEKIFVTTSIHMSDAETALLEELNKDLSQAGIKVIFGENMMHNAKAMEQMSEIGQVVLIEKKNVSWNDSIERELLLCAQQKANVLGVIGLE